MEGFLSWLNVAQFDGADVRTMDGVRTISLGRALKRWLLAEGMAEVGGDYSAYLEVVVFVLVECLQARTPQGTVDDEVLPLAVPPRSEWEAHLTEADFRQVRWKCFQERPACAATD